MVGWMHGLLQAEAVRRMREQRTSVEEAPIDVSVYLCAAEVVSAVPSIDR